MKPPQVTMRKMNVPGRECQNYRSAMTSVTVTPKGTLGKDCVTDNSSRKDSGGGKMGASEKGKGKATVGDFSAKDS